MSPVKRTQKLSRMVAKYDLLGKGSLKKRLGIAEHPAARSRTAEVLKTLRKATPGSRGKSKLSGVANKLKEYHPRTGLTHPSIR